MNDDQLPQQSATELTRLIRTKALSPVDLMRATIARAEALNPQLNAICTPTYETAMEQARAAEQAVMRGRPLGMLHGVPATIKDLSFTKGVRTMGGSNLYRERVPDFDHLHVERLRDAGAISIGKTTVPELGWKGTSHSLVTGITHNPWQPGMNAGGSSAGAAVCAAVGIGPLHQGSDGAGSVRMPAAFCGVYGLKPSFGRIPYHPHPNNGLISHVGPLTWTVADAALLLSALAGNEDRDMWSLEAPVQDYAAALDGSIAGLKVAYSPDLGYLRVDPEVADVVRRAVSAFEELGCRVEEVDPGWGDPIEIEHCLFASAYAGMLGSLLATRGHELDPGLAAITRHGQTYSAADYCRAQGERFAYYDRVHNFFQRYDLLLTPSLSVAAFPAHRLIPEHWEQHPWDWLRWAGFSYPFNLTGQPAATCPCGFTPSGLPVGLQIVGARLRDWLVLQASRAFETARPWAARRPALAAA
jgi:aspartyl-tRNA(Asn)/glutamyl-tRNA(Gln) amidotransferase subunit A